MVGVAVAMVISTMHEKSSVCVSSFLSDDIYVR